MEFPLPPKKIFHFYVILCPNMFFRRITFISLSNRNASTFSSFKPKKYSLTFLLCFEKDKQLYGLLHFVANRWKKGKQQQILFFWASKSLWVVTAAMKLKDSCSLEGNYDKPRQSIKKQRHHIANKGLYSQSCGFPSSHVQM